MYLDYAAGQLTKAEVITYMNSLRETIGFFANPHSTTHMPGIRAGQIISRTENDLRALDKDMFGFENAKYTWVGSGTEANRLAILSVLKYHDQYCQYGQFDHKSVKQMGILQGFPSHVNSGGIIDGDRFIPCPNVKLLNICCVNSETGAFFDSANFEKILNKLRSEYSQIDTVHFDMVQGSGDIGKAELDILRNSGIRVIITRSSHKIGGPQGLGVIISDWKNDILYPGTPDPIAVAGYTYAYMSHTEAQEYMPLRSTIHEVIEKYSLHEHLELADFNTSCVENIAVLICKDVDAFEVATLVDHKDIQVSLGSACNSNGRSDSYNILLGEKRSKSAIRLSLPINYETQEIREDAYKAVTNDLIALFNIVKEIKNGS